MHVLNNLFQYIAIIVLLYYCYCLSDFIIGMYVCIGKNCTYSVQYYSVSGIHLRSWNISPEKGRLQDTFREKKIPEDEA